MSITSNSNIIIGQNLRLLREKLGLSQEILSQYLNITREQVSYYENGTRAIPTNHLSKLADLFCINEYDFYEENVQNRNINIAFAFRADELNKDDLDKIAKFKKIVRNYVNIKRATSDE